MRLFYFILTAAPAALLCVSAAAANLITTKDALEEIKLHGKVLKHPYIMETKPNGVVVAHDYGVMFVKYSEMPEDIRKKLGYDPKKCASYEKRQRAARAEDARRAAAKKAHDAELEKRLAASQEKYEINSLKDKILRTEERIKRLKAEIPQLEQATKECMNSAVSVARGGDNNNNNSGGYWRNGFWNNNQNTNRRDARNRSKTVESLGDEYSANKFRLENFRDELEKKEPDLIEMKARLKQMEQKQKQHQAQEQKNGGKKKGFFGSLF